MEEELQGLHDKYAAIVKLYQALLVQFGAEVTVKQEQYCLSIIGIIDGVEFKFRVHHDKDGEFTKIDWQKAKQKELKDIKKLFDLLSTIFSSLNGATPASCKLFGKEFKLDDNNNGGD